MCCVVWCGVCCVCCVLCVVCFVLCVVSVCRALSVVLHVFPNMQAHVHVHVQTISGEFV